MAILTAIHRELRPVLVRYARRGRRLLGVRDMAHWVQFRTLRRRYYAEFWQRAAAAVGASHADWGGGFQRISRGPAATLVRQGEVMLDSHLMLELMGDKSLVYRLMAETGLAVPGHHCFTLETLDGALDFQRAHPGAVVVKPARGTGGGNGVTTGIFNANQLRDAAGVAARFADSLIVERQVEGHSYRLLFLDGRFIDAIRRDPPQVIGNGRKTLKRLIAEENRRRLGGASFEALSPLSIDRDCRNWLAEQGLSLSYRPGDGEHVQVKRAVNQNAAHENHVVRDQVDARTIVACERLVRHLGVRLAGVDVFARDIALPLDGGNGLIGEINTTPGLHHHDLVAETGEAAGVGEIILTHLFNTGSGIIGAADNVKLKQVAA